MELSEEHQVKAQPFASEKLYQGRHHPLRTFFHQPAPSVLQNEESDVGRHQLHLMCQEFTIGFFASHRQGELGLRKLRKIAGGLLERNEVGSARAHASRLGVGLRACTGASGVGPSLSLCGSNFLSPNCLEPPNSAVVAS